MKALSGFLQLYQKREETNPSFSRGIENQKENHLREVRFLRL